MSSRTSKVPAKAPSQRQLRVGEEVRHALVRLFTHTHLRDPELAELNITVTEVRLSPDLKNATAFIVPLGGGELERTVKALNRAAAFLRRELAREVVLRHTPRLSFQADHSFDEAARLRALFERPKVRQDLVDSAKPGAEEIEQIVSDPAEDGTDRHGT